MGNIVYFPKVEAADVLAFAESCDEMCRSRLIISDKRIAGILMCVTRSEAMVRFFGWCLQDFDYAEAMRRACVPAEGERGKFTLKLPEGKHRVAFVFCLLHELDEKRRDFTAFLTGFFGLDELFSDGFLRFCTEVIVPFRDTVLQLIANAPAYTGSRAEAAPRQAEAAPQAQAAPAAPAAPARETRVPVAAVCRDLMRALPREPLLSPAEREKFGRVIAEASDAWASGNMRLFVVLSGALEVMGADCRTLSGGIKQLARACGEIA